METEQLLSSDSDDAGCDEPVLAQVHDSKGWLTEPAKPNGVYPHREFRLDTVWGYISRRE